MTKMQNVERVYLHESIKITNTKTKRTDYKNGAFLNEVRQTVMTYGAMYSLLSCGHTRKWQGGENFTNSKRLSCHYCDSDSWHAAKLSDATGDDSKAHHKDVLARNSEWAAENKALVIDHAKAWVTLDSPAPDDIRQARKNVGLSQTEAARLIGKPLRTWQGWEAAEVVAAHRKMDGALWSLWKIKVAELSGKK